MATPPAGSTCPTSPNLFGDFCQLSTKLENVGQTFPKFQSMSILAIRCSRRQETVSVSKYSLSSKTGPLLLESIRCEKSFSFFKNIANSVN